MEYNGEIIMKSISFIHGADLHLDSPMVGLSYLPKEIFERLKESTFTALSHLVDAAIVHEVDFVILAGDLFDEQDRSVRAQIRLQKEMERLNKEEIEVFVIHGNHDHLNGDWVHLDFPKNVHVFPERVEVKFHTTKTNAVAHLYGFSYPTRHLENNYLSQYRKKKEQIFTLESSMVIMRAIVTIAAMLLLQQRNCYRKSLIIGH